MEATIGGGERVVLPEPLFPDAHEPRAAQVGEVPRDGRLRSPQHGHEVTHADLAVVLEEMEDAQPRPIRKGSEHTIHAGGGLHAAIVGGQKGLASNEASILRLFESGFATSTST